MVLSQIVILFCVWSICYCESCSGKSYCCYHETDHWWNGNCYYYRNVINSWTNAEIFCDSWFPDGHTVSIHSQEEEDFLNTDVAGGLSYWLGLHKNVSYACDSAMELYWTDGSDVSYALERSKCCTYFDAQCWLQYSAGWYDATDDYSAPSQRQVCKVKLECYGFEADDLKVCSGKGKCWTDDYCECDSDYYGANCSDYMCFQIAHNDTENVCNGHGLCTDLDECVCDNGYIGLNCSSINVGLCNEEGEHLNEDTGKCYTNLGDLGLNFTSSNEECNEIYFNVDESSSLFSIHSDEENMFIQNTIFTTSTRDFIWIGLHKNETDDMSGDCTSGMEYWIDGSSLTFADVTDKNCSGLQNEQCFGIVRGGSGEWDDLSCDRDTNVDTGCQFLLPFCDGIRSDNFTCVCSGKGKCVGNENCDCLSGHYGDNCEYYDCFGLRNDDLGYVCTGHGTCVESNVCNCYSDSDFLGVNCNITSCFSMTSTDPLVCSQHGDCFDIDYCLCDPEYGGEKCDEMAPCQDKVNDLVWDDHCYRFFGDKGRSFAESEKNCQTNWTKGSHLISFRNETERLWVENNVFPGSVSIWIGLRKQEHVATCLMGTSERDLVWTDDSNPYYVNNNISDSRMYCTTDTGRNICFSRKGTLQYTDEILCYQTLAYPSCKYKLPYCYGLRADMDPNLVCSGKGICISDDNCFCSNREMYFHQECNITKCNRIFSNITELVCSGHGTCWPYEQCNCGDDYYGELCEVTTCDGVFSNDTENVCYGKGKCWPFDICSCDDDYFGESCNISTCFGIFSNDSDNELLCSGHGVCIGFDTCDCTVSGSDYFGENCHHTYCYGVASTSIYPRVCSGKGNCWPKDRCECEEDYFGINCNVTTCNEIFSNTSEVCHAGKGICFPKDMCTCFGPPYIGEFCKLAHLCSSPGEFAYEGNCYKNMGNMGNWNLSELACQGWFHPRSHLLSIHTTNEHSFIRTNILMTDTPLFIGASKMIASAAEQKLYPCPVLPGGYRFTDHSNDTYLVSLGSIGVNCTTNESCFIMDDGYPLGNGDLLDTGCFSNYFPMAGCEYNLPICFGVFANEEELVCSAHGYCFDDNNCTCHDNDFFINTGDYDGERCNYTYCDGFHSLSEEACNGNGFCFPFDICSCDEDYYGTRCDIPSCNNILSNYTSIVCSSHGDCVDVDECQCDEKYFGEDCEISTCDGVFSNISESDLVCSGHGVCVSYDNCSCLNYPEYSGSNCEEWRCNDVSKTNEFVCSGHGTCIDSNNCSCSDVSLYSGDYCEIWTCFDVVNTDIDLVCGGHGYCVGIDECSCLSGYESDIYQGECTEWYCGVFHKDDNEVCSGRGTCIESHTCECGEEEYSDSDLDSGFYGDECELWSCGGIVYFSASACSGNGVCDSPSTCICDYGFTGENCGTSWVAIAVGTPLATFGVGTILICCFCGFCLISLFLCCIAIIGCCGCTIIFILSGIITVGQAGRLKKFGQLKNFDLLLKEQEMEDDVSIAHLRVDKSLFEIPMDELNLYQILGEGGSASVVYLAKWKRRKVAFKCFKTRTVCENQDSFDEFEREISVLRSVSHPNIIQSYGCSMKPPRVGIVMEYCSKGDMEEFLKKYLCEHLKPYPDKIRLANEVAGACEYLHSRNIIHRDLKPENVLLDDKESCRLMDFGLSRIIDRMSKAKTKKVGTSFYMAPELVLSSKYDEKVDVFSFGMMLYVIFTENYTPFRLKSSEGGSSSSFTSFLDSASGIKNSAKGSSGYSGSTNLEMKIATDENFRPDLNELIFRNEGAMRKDDINWLCQLIRKCWRHNPKSRPSFDHISMLFNEWDKISSKSSDDLMKKEVEKEIDDEEEEKEGEEEEDLVVENNFLKKKVLVLEKEIEDLKMTNKEKDELIGKLKKEK